MWVLCICPSGQTVKKSRPRKENNTLLVASASVNCVQFFIEFPSWKYEVITYGSTCLIAGPNLFSISLCRCSLFKSPQSQSRQVPTRPGLLLTRFLLPGWRSIVVFDKRIWKPYGWPSFFFSLNQNWTKKNQLESFKWVCANGQSRLIAVWFWPSLSWAILLAEALLGNLRAWVSWKEVIG